MTGAVEKPLTQYHKNNGRGKKAVNHSSKEENRDVVLCKEKFYIFLERNNFFPLTKGLLMDDLSMTMVTDSLTGRLPMEFVCSFSISFPSEKSQIQRWESYLKAGICEKKSVIDMVEQFPMYFHEIDQIARHAKVAGILDNRQGNMTLADIYRTIKKRHC